MEETFFNPLRRRQAACINQSQAHYAFTIRYWPPDVSDHHSDYSRNPGVNRPPGCAVMLPHSSQSDAALLQEFHAKFPALRAY
eukprot:6514040-Karenia_brevis.AAC.1